MMIRFNQLSWECKLTAVKLTFRELTLRQSDVIHPVTQHHCFLRNWVAFLFVTYNGLESQPWGGVTICPEASCDNGREKLRLDKLLGWHVTARSNVHPSMPLWSYLCLFVCLFPDRLILLSYLLYLFLFFIGGSRRDWQTRFPGEFFR